MARCQRLAALCLMAAAAFGAGPAAVSSARAQSPEIVAQTIPPGLRTDGPTGLPETFEIGLSTEQIVIASNFSGTRLVVFGALDNADGRILRQGGYDIVVALEGPTTPIVVREKERVFGLWINAGSESFDDAPASYALASTRRLTDIAPQAVLEKLSIGIEFMRTHVGDSPPTSRINRDAYATALRRIKMERGLYNEAFGSIEFVSATLFRAELALSADLPVGRHVARAFLFRQGVFLRERNVELWVVKSGFETTISNLAAGYGVVYGIFAVILAILTGWFGRLVFKRD